MAIVDGSLQLGYKDSAWFTANASLVLLVGQIVYLEQTGTYKLGDGVTQLSALTFLGGGGTVDVNTIGAAINGATSATPNDTDLVMSVDTSVAKKNTWTQIKAFLKTYFDTVYATITDLTGYVKKGTLTTNYIPKATASDTIGDSTITDDGSNVTIDNSGYTYVRSGTIGNQGELYIYDNGADLYNLNCGFFVNEGSPSPLKYFQSKIAENKVVHDIKNTFDAPANNFPQLTASQIVETDSSKNLVSAAKATGYNLALGTTAGTVTEGNDSRLSDARAEKMYAYQNTDSTVTGSTSQTVLFNGKINAGDMGTNGRLTVNAVPFKSGTAGTFTLTMYVSTVGTNTVGSTGVPTSSTQLGIVALTSTQLFGGNFNRSLANKNSASTNNAYPTSVAIINDNSQTTSARTTININTANDFWVVITGQLSNAGDTGGLDNVQCQIDKP